MFLEQLFHHRSVATVLALAVAADREVDVMREACEQLVQTMPELSIAIGPDIDHKQWIEGAKVPKN